MRTHLLLAALVLIVAAPALASAQGYYQNTLRRNPYTGRWEVVPTGQVETGAFGPYRNQRTFYGESFNPYDGTLSRSMVQRNPFTGRLEVINDTHNPYTGGRWTDTTRFNPATGRYETVNLVEPPTNPIPASAAQPAVAAQPAEAAEPVDPAQPPATIDGTTPQRTTVGKPIVRPKIIENKFPPTPAPP